MDEKQGTGTGQAGDVQSNAATRAGGNGPNPQENAQGSGGSTESLVDQARNTVADVADRASDVAREAYDQGQQYVRQAGDRYPQAQRYYERATQTIGHQFTEAPLVSLLAVGAVGLGMAWIIGGLTRSEVRAPSRGTTTGRDYPGQRSGKPLIESDRVEGTAVYDRSGKRIGTVERVMIDKISGRVAYAVMSFGGFFGVGANEYAVPWRMLDYDPRLGGYRIQITSEQLRRAPSLSGRSQDWPDRESEQDLHDFYQVSYYWLLP